MRFLIVNQKKAKFNIVDIIVLLVLVAGIAFVGMRMFGGNDADQPTAGSSGETFRVTFYAESVPQAVADSLEIGAKAENNSRNVDLGTLVDFTVGESVNYSTDQNGQFLVSPKPGYCSIELTCELSGDQEPTGLLVGEFMLNIGHYMTVRAGNTEIAVYITDIQSVNAQ